MKLTSMLLVIVMSIAVPSRVAAQTSSGDIASMWRTYAQNVPIGSTVKLRLTTGQSLTAVLFAAGDSTMTVKPATRIPERTRRIAYGDVRSIERAPDHVNFAKHVAIGAAIGAGVFLGLLAGAR